MIRLKVKQGITPVLVTHDNDLAQRVPTAVVEVEVEVEVRVKAPIKMASSLSPLLSVVWRGSDAGYITAVLGFAIGALWFSVIGNNLPVLVDTLGAILAPLYGGLVVDYYLIQRRSVKVSDLYSMNPKGRYFYQNGWNARAILAITVAGVFRSRRSGYPHWAGSVALPG